MGVIISNLKEVVEFKLSDHEMCVLSDYYDWSENQKRNFNALSDIEKIFQKLSCLNRSWSERMFNLVRIYFGECNDELQSNWVLRHFPDKTYLELISYESSDRITDYGLEKMTTLQTLYLDRNNSISNIALKKLTTLTSLSVDSCQVSDEGLSHLVNLKQLNMTSENHISDEGLKSHTNLTILDLHSNDIITGIYLSKLSNLTEINLSRGVVSSSYGVTSKALTKMSKFSSLKKLNLEENSLIDNACLKKLTSLTELDLSSNSMISDVSLKKLTNLRKLVLAGNGKITDDGIMNLINLKSLTIKYMSISYEGIKNLTNLTELYFYGSKIKEDQLEELKKLPSSLKIFQF